MGRKTGTQKMKRDNRWNGCAKRTGREEVVESR